MDPRCALYLAGFSLHGCGGWMDSVLCGPPMIYFRMCSICGRRLSFVGLSRPWTSVCQCMQCIARLRRSGSWPATLSDSLFLRVGRTSEFDSVTTTSKRPSDANSSQTCRARTKNWPWLDALGQSQRLLFGKFHFTDWPPWMGECIYEMGRRREFVVLQTLTLNLSHQPTCPPVRPPSTHPPIWIFCGRETHKKCFRSGACAGPPSMNYGLP